MVFIVTISLQTSLTSPHCGLRPGLAGKSHSKHESLRLCYGINDYLILVSFNRFTEFGGPIHQRPVEDLAFAVARFIQKGGSFVNYYMVSLLNFLLHFVPW